MARARDSECRALANLGEKETATSACEEARQIYVAAGDRSGLAQTLHDMAEVPINQGDFAAAEKLLQSSADHNASHRQPEPLQSSSRMPLRNFSLDSGFLWSGVA